ncbi:MAG: hypothetical protein A3B30_03185 [Candidatus Komeilibacteria bacterium RIFCSPLOWO2_01_FULL_52_15]|uniref:Uncharacterized protein n=2 Tax=Candidatus Komeiliibacteriota TaxID=1817908 RepID=A0A1G2BMU0_9BACT|nr:MAG: hypothetical protein A2677_03620 [Candidatus Komeilibacteria bacterium RIFCSPHIGHO2_01_FULL_52_14]OGY90455.1 MAG: hypothetical protein A3B30_03185 [Candidatus Komeilibacteria bacterium RIFCSPLOWO2_01_FULL_52_15]
MKRLATFSVILLVPAIFAIVWADNPAPPPTGTEFEDALQARILGKAGLPKNLGEIVGKTACFKEQLTPPTDQGLHGSVLSCAAIKVAVYEDLKLEGGGLRVVLYLEADKMLPFKRLEYELYARDPYWVTITDDGKAGGRGKLTVH